MARVGPGNYNTALFNRGGADRPAARRWPVNFSKKGNHSLLQPTAFFRWLTFLCLALALAQPGAPRRAPSGGAPAYYDFGRPIDEWATRFLRQPDGKLLLVGSSDAGAPYMAAARFNPDGSPDVSFGSGGLALVFQGAVYAEAWDAVLQANGKLVIVGSAQMDEASDPDFALARLNPDGSLDAAFGQAGLAHTDFGFDREDYACAVALQADGKIVVGGQASLPTGLPAPNDYDYALALARYTPDGALDPTFGAGGRVSYNRLPAVPGYDQVYDLLAQPDGKIAAVVDADMLPAVLRLKPDGGFDPTFSQDGLATLETGLAVANRLVLQSDGKLVAGGSFSSDDGDQVVLARLLNSGALDPNFGPAGFAVAAQPGSVDLLDLALLPDGRLLALTSQMENPAPGVWSDTWAAARFSRSGKLDVGFGDGGRLALDLSDQDTPAGILALPDGRLMLGGDALGPDGSQDFALARFSADGALDAAFGAGGKAIANLARGADQALAAALLPQGKILAAGSISQLDPLPALARFSAAGAPDPGFGPGGPAAPLLALANGRWSGLAVLDDGRLLLAGDGALAGQPGAQDALLARYTAAGALDPTFGGLPTAPGLRVIDLHAGSDPTQPTQDEVHALALQPDGKAVLAGAAWLADGSALGVVARFTATGELDTAFGGDGLVTDAACRQVVFTALALQADGKLAAVGWQDCGAGPRFLAARFLPDGSPDPAFDGDGRVPLVFPVAGDQQAQAVAVQPDGAILLAGFAGDGSQRDFALARLLPTGALDPAFSAAGLALLDFNAGADQAAALLLQPDGRIAAAGAAANGPAGARRDAALARLLPDGALDPDFGWHGRVIWAAGGLASSQLNALQLQPGGDYLAAGWAWNQTSEDFLLLPLPASRPTRSVIFLPLIRR